MNQQLTPEQLTALGHSYLACAQAVGNFRYVKKLSREADNRLSDLQWTLLNYSDDFYTSSAIIIMTDVKSSLTRIKLITREINETYHRIRSVQKAIDVATSAITLAAALFSKNPIAIHDALENLRKQWKG